MNRFRLREHGSGITVATLSSTFGVTLLLVVGHLTTLIKADDFVGSSNTLAIVLPVVGAVFIVIATYVGAVVTTNTFATIIAGRTRSIALLRLIGASASSQRRAVAFEGLIVGVLGSLLGAVVGIALTTVLLRVRCRAKPLQTCPMTMFSRSSRSRSWV